jgi:hypothetical protein
VKFGKVTPMAQQLMHNNTLFRHLSIAKGFTETN